MPAALRNSSTRCSDVPLLRYTAWVFATCLALYGGLLGASYISYPYSADRDIDTQRAKASLYATEPKYLVFNLSALDHEGARVLLLGGSNVREGLRPNFLKPRIGNVEVDNLAIGACDVREVAQIVDAVYAHVPQTSWSDLTFVVGIWYGLFRTAARSWPNGVTDIDNELLRYGLYYRDGPIMRRRVPQSWEPVLQQALRPLLWISRIYDAYVSTTTDWLRIRLLRLVGEVPLDVSVTDRDRFTLTPAQRAASLDYWRQYMGPADAWDGRPFVALAELARIITRHGSRLVLLDLPLPPWHRAGVPYDDDYRRLEQSLLRETAALPGVTYRSMQDNFGDDDFYDSAHPRPRATARWAEQAAGAIGPAIHTSAR